MKESASKQIGFEDLEQKLEILSRKHPPKDTTPYEGGGYYLLPSGLFLSKLVKDLQDVLGHISDKDDKRKEFLTNGVVMAEFVDEMQDLYSSNESIKGIITDICKTLFSRDNFRSNLTETIPRIKENLTNNEISKLITTYDLNHKNELEPKVITSKYEAKKEFISTLFITSIYTPSRIKDIIRIAKRFEDGKEHKKVRCIFYGLADSSAATGEVIDTLKIYEGLPEETNVSAMFARINRGNADDDSDKVKLNHENYVALIQRVCRLFNENGPKFIEHYKSPEDLYKVQELLFNITRDTFFNKPNEQLIGDMTHFLLDPGNISQIIQKKGDSFDKFENLYDNFGWGGSQTGLHASFKPDQMKELAYQILNN